MWFCILMNLSALIWRIFWIRASGASTRWSHDPPVKLSWSSSTRRQPRLPRVVFARIRTKALMVFKLDDEGNTVYTQDMGDLVMFLSNSEPFYVPATSFPGLYPNYVEYPEQIFTLLGPLPHSTTKYCQVLVLDSQFFFSVTSYLFFCIIDFGYALGENFDIIYLPANYFINIK